MDKIIPKSTDKKDRLLQYIRILNNEVENLEHERSKANDRTKQEARKVFRLEREIHKLNSELKSKDDEIKKLKEKIKDLKSDTPKEQAKNERNAGRKSIVTNRLVKDVKLLHENENTQKSIADILGVSVGTVNKIIKQLNN